MQVIIFIITNLWSATELFNLVEISAQTRFFYSLHTLHVLAILNGQLPRPARSILGLIRCYIMQIKFLFVFVHQLQGWMNIVMKEQLSLTCLCGSWTQTLPRSDNQNPYGTTIILDSGLLTTVIPGLRGSPQCAYLTITLKQLSMWHNEPRHTLPIP